MPTQSIMLQIDDGQITILNSKRKMGFTGLKVGVDVVQPKIRVKKKKLVLSKSQIKGRRLRR